MVSIAYAIVIEQLKAASIGIVEHDMDGSRSSLFSYDIMLT